MRVRIILVAVVLGLGAITVAVLSGESTSRPSSRRVIAAFYPVAFAAETVSSGTYSVRNLTPPGAEPHDLEVSPRDVADLKRAAHVLVLGHGFQPQLERAAGRGPRTELLLDAPGVRRFSNGDPHVWLDPIRYAHVVERIGVVLHRPRAAATLAARVRVLDRLYRVGLAHCRRREIVTGHEAFGYLARRYGLRQVPISGLSPDAEPSARVIAHVVDLVRQTRATTVYLETLASPRLSRTVARETGSTTAVLDPIEGLTPSEQHAGQDYFALMRSNLDRLRKGLGCR